MSYEASVVGLREKILVGLKAHASESRDSSGECGDEFIRVLCDTRGRETVDALTSDDAFLLSHALQATVLQLARMAREEGCSVMKLEENGVGMVSFFIDSVMNMALTHSSLIDLSAPAMCLEVLMEVTTTMNSIDIFDYLDSRMDMFTKPGVRQKSQYTLLRTCNVLLKRLSKSQDAELCGRVLIFLAKFLPLTERSGVNMYGSFHVDNTTPLEEVKEGSLDAEGRPIDIEFYNTFWGLQKWFSDPRLALSPGAWDSISESLKLVLKKFNSTNVTVTEAAGSNASIQDSLSNKGDGSSVKYLSSARLLPLQIRDATFRRTILVQSLILIGWMEDPLLKDWVSKKPTERVLGSMIHMKQKIYQQLKQTPENGVTFADAIRKVLDGEMAWNLWKQAGCPAGPFQTSQTYDSDQLKDEILYPEPKKVKKSADAVFGVDLGVPELTRLWNQTEDNLTMLAADDRGGFTNLRQLMDPVIDEMNDPEQDEMFSVSKDIMYNWKTLRVVARESLPTFAAAVRAGGDLKIAARILYPHEVPADMEEVEVEEEKLEGDEQEQELEGPPKEELEAGAGEVVEVEEKNTTIEAGKKSGDSGAEEEPSNKEENLN